MADTISALDKMLQPGRFGCLQNGKPTVTLQEIKDMSLTQMAAFPHQKAAFHSYLNDTLHCGLPQAGKVEGGTYSVRKAGKSTCFLARLDPAKIMLISKSKPVDLPSEFYPLDLTEARTVLKIQGDNATALLARLCALNFSDAAFPEGSIAMTGMHHVSVSIWRHQDAYIAFLPRSFAASLFHLMLQIAEQFGCEVLDSAAWS